MKVISTQRTTYTPPRTEKAGLLAYVSNGDEKPPRFPVKSLSDADLEFEISRAEPGDYLDALNTEAAHRGMEV